MLVKQFHKLSRTVEFDLFRFLELELLNFKTWSSTEFRKDLYSKILDKGEIPDGWGPLVSDSVENGPRAV